MKKNVLITGVSGFIGSYLAKYLLENGSNVFGLARWRTVYSPTKNLVDRGIYGAVQMVDGDLTDISSLAHALDIAKPDIIFHLGAQSFIPRSFVDPVETAQINLLGTQNLLEAIRLKNLDPVVVYAGSSEEYGLVIWSEKQYEQAKRRYKVIFPEPIRIPEVPINECNPLRPMSPYAVSKVACDYLVRNAFHCYGIKTIVSRGFNTEGAGRGNLFVTAAITRQVTRLKFKEQDKIVIGNVNMFRDWSHVEDIVHGYTLLVEKANYGDVYNQGSCRTNSVLSYLLLSLENAGWKVEKIETLNGSKAVDNPTKKIKSAFCGAKFDRTRVDQQILDCELEYSMEDAGLKVHTDKGPVIVEFDPAKFRPAEVPILLANTSKIRQLGFSVTHSLEDIIRDQLNYYMKAENRR